MDWEIILKGGGLLVAGILFVWLGFLSWRYRREERINLIEAAILKATDTNPLPRNRSDRVMAYIQPVLFLVFGPLMIVGGVGILSLLGE